MRPILFCLIFALVLGGLFYSRISSIPGKMTFLEVTDLPNSKLNPNATRTVLAMNDHWRNVRSIVYPKLTVQSHGFKLDSCLLYEKPRNFKMVNWSFLGKESELGSDQDYFWFWSKRMNPPALYYARHEDLPKTNLKTPFNPNWLAEIVGINEIPTAVVASDYNQYVVIMYEAKSLTGEMVTRAYLVDPKTKAFVGHYVFNAAWQPIISAEITDHYVINGFYVPKEMTVIWFEENFRSKWYFEQPQINVAIDPENWKMPEIKERINLDGNSPSVKVSQVF